MVAATAAAAAAAATAEFEDEEADEFDVDVGECEEIVAGLEEGANGGGLVGDGDEYG